MKVSELIELLQSMPQDATVVIFDGPAYATPHKVFVWEKEDRLKDCVIID